MQTQEGENVGVSAIEGNFDDAQSGVKKIFSDSEFRSELSRARNRAFEREFDKLGKARSADRLLCIDLCRAC